MLSDFSRETDVIPIQNWVVSGWTLIESLKVYEACDTNGLPAFCDQMSPVPGFGARASDELELTTEARGTQGQTKHFSGLLLSLVNKGLRP